MAAACVPDLHNALAALSCGPSALVSTPTLAVLWVLRDDEAALDFVARLEADRWPSS